MDKNYPYLCSVQKNNMFNNLILNNMKVLTEYEELITAKYAKLEEYLTKLCDGQDKFIVPCGISHGSYTLNTDLEVSFLWLPTAERKINIVMQTKIGVGYASFGYMAEQYFKIDSNAVEFFYAEHFLMNLDLLVSGIKSVIHARNRALEINVDNF